MRWIDRFGSKYRNFGIQNLMLYLMATQAFIFIVSIVLEIPLVSYLSFSRTLILQGQIWRLITFVFVPIRASLFWFIIVCYLYYTIGQSLENKLGTPTFNLYIIIGILGAILAGFIGEYTTNVYLFLSIFFAYAFYFPDDEIRLYFMITIKTKYLAIAAIIIYGIQAFRAIKVGNWYILIAQVFSLINALIFFGPTLMDNVQRSLKNKKRREQFERDMRGSGWGDDEDKR